MTLYDLYDSNALNDFYVFYDFYALNAFKELL
jgi:hypothetical protein